MGSHPCIHFLLPRVPFLSLPAPSAPSFLFPFLFPPLLPRLSSFSFCGRWPCCRFSSGKLALLTLSNTDVLGRIALRSLGYPHSRVLQEQMNRSSSICDADAGGPKVRRRPRSPRKEVLLGHVLDTHKVKRWAIAIRVFMHRGYTCRHCRCGMSVMLPTGRCHIKLSIRTSCDATNSQTTLGHLYRAMLCIRGRPTSHGPVSLSVRHKSEFY